MEEVAAVSNSAITMIAGQGDAEVIQGASVSPSLFSVLRAPPLLGRTLVEDDGGPEPDNIIVLSYGL